MYIFICSTHLCTSASGVLAISFFNKTTIAFQYTRSFAVKADALFGTPDVIALVERSDIATIDAVIDEIALVPKVQGTDSRAAR